MGFFHFNEKKGEGEKLQSKEEEGREGFSDYPIDFSLAEAGRQGVMMGKEGTKAERIIKKRAGGVQERKTVLQLKCQKRGREEH